MLHNYTVVLIVQMIEHSSGYQKDTLSVPVEVENLVLLSTSWEGVCSLNTVLVQANIIRLMIF